jgi:hypothetical protein
MLYSAKTQNKGRHLKLAIYAFYDPFLMKGVFLADKKVLNFEH